MTGVKIPTESEFKSLTGRAGITSLFKTKNDLGPIFQAVKAFEPYASNTTDASIPFVRAVRRACITWLNNNPGMKRKSKPAVQTLMRRADNRFIGIVEFNHRGEQLGTNVTLAQAKAAMPKRPVLPFATELHIKHGTVLSRPIRRVGNEMQLPRERVNPLHLGPNIRGSAEQKYKSAYTQKGGSLLSLGAWLTHVYPANVEDDPVGNLLGSGSAGPWQLEFASKLGGVTYCTAEERKAYVKTIKGGIFHNIDDTPFDTRGMETHNMGFGWAIYTLGYDNQLYSNSHIVDQFHHSSFWAGDPVQCGGEICVEAGKLRYVTPKTGHYRSGSREFYRMLSFLAYHEVDLQRVLCCPSPHNDKQMYNAYEVYDRMGQVKQEVSDVGVTPVMTHWPTRKNTADGAMPEWPPGVAKI